MKKVTSDKRVLQIELISKCYLYKSMYGITESQYVRGWKGPLWVI